MAQYTKRADGRYSTKVRLPDGKNKYLYGKTQTELKQKVAKLQAEINTGTYADDKGYTVKEWAVKWFETYKADRSFNRRKGISTVINTHLKPIENMRLKEVKRTDIHILLNALADRPSAQKNAFYTIKEMFETAVDDDLIYKNPCKGIKLPRMEKPETRGLTKEEREVIPTIDFTTREKAYVYLSWYTGMRPEEIRGLMKSDIDLQNRVIKVNKAVVFTEKDRPQIKEPKTAAGVREIDILDPLLPVLSDFLKEVDSFLFADKNGNLLTKKRYWTFWKKIKAKVNTALGGNDKIQATNIYPYVFRHEYATILYYSGIDLKEAVRLMGHTDIKMILNVYAELDKKRSNSSEKLNQFLANY